MILFTGTFLPKAVWITVKDSSTFTSVTKFLHLFSGGEFRTSICEDYWKKLFECLLPQNCFQPYKDLQDAFLILIFKKEHEHKIAVSERKG